MFADLKKLFARSRVAKRIRLKPRVWCPTVEILEDRCVPAPLVVNNNFADNVANPFAGSLRAVINVANAGAGGDIIKWFIRLCSG